MSTETASYITGTMERKVIYVYKKDYAEEEGYIKIGDASIDRPDANFENNSFYLNTIAERRIREYDNSSPITILYSTVAIDKSWKVFRDHKVHEVLTRSGIPKVTKGKSTEWFKTDTETAIKAINAVKEGRSTICSDVVSESQYETITFRPEQEEAITKTISVLKSKKDMLWNAKMRFGKTLSALEVVKRMKYKRTLILTHRPIVDSGWYEDFHKIFSGYNESNYIYGSKNRGEKIENLLNNENKNPYIIFASIQDLRGAARVGGIYEKNEEIFNVDWDLVIIDEAHEGTQTKLAENVLGSLGTKRTRFLSLSGTPFNLMDEYDEEQIYTWDYVMEQEAKANWDKTYPGDSNPYNSMPELKMYVYQLGDIIKNNAFVDLENKAFNFSEFFRVDDLGKFVYEKEVWSFLNIISRSEDYSKDKTNMPFSTAEYRNELKHTLWTMPSRASATALEKLIKDKHHPIFYSYNIANLVDDEEHATSDLKKIRDAITSEPDKNKSITLTVRKGTVGTTVKEWTGILVLNNTESASNYLQSIFRVQSPYIGKEGQKEKAYVFDFAPDRTLKMIAEAAKLNIRSGSINSKIQTKQMEKLLNFLPIIGIDGNKMKHYSVKSMMRQLKRAQAERAVRMGFDDTSIYSDELLRLTDVDLKEFEDLMSIIGRTKQTKRVNSLVINDQGMSDEEWESLEKGLRKQKKERSPEEQAAIDKRKQLQKQKQSMISILRGISIRIPLMIYGMDLEIDEDVTIDNFASKVDEVSWKEFMPKGITKWEFNKFKKYYDADIFIEAGRRIRRMAESADNLGFEDRIDKITSLFSNFKNPDKETVLTPWRVVNMHLGETLGGYNFYEEDYSEKDEDFKDIRYIDKGEITEKVFHKDVKVLEINSKTGLYPLYMAYSIYKNRWNNESPNWSKSEWIDRDNDLWTEVLENNIYVLNKTPMARTITYRTLNGYRKNKKVWDNLVYIENLTHSIKSSLDTTTKEIKNRFGGNDVRFDVVVGNPPYQENDEGKRADGSINASASPLYHLFMDLAKNIAPIQTLIMPARWTTGAGKGLGNFKKEMLSDKHIKSFHMFTNSSEVFPNTDIKGGVVYLTRDISYSGETKIVVISSTERIERFGYLDKDKLGVFIPSEVLLSIYRKVASISNLNEDNIQSITSLKPYGLRTDFFVNQRKYKLPSISETRNKDDDLEIVGLFKGKRTLRYLNKDYPIPTGTDTIYKFKVFIPYAYGAGEFGESIPGPIVGEKGMISTETFLRVGMFDTLDEALALRKYISTKFFRALVGVLKTTQHSTTTYKLVPLQNFTKKSDIDWNNSIKEIDQQLYEKYDLSEEEIYFIEEKVREMD